MSTPPLPPPGTPPPSSPPPLSPPNLPVSGDPPSPAPGPPTSPPLGPPPGPGTPLAAPPLQADPTPGTPSQEGQKKSKLPWIIGAAAVLAVIAIAAVVFVVNDDDPSGGIDVAGAHDGLETVIDDADFDDTGSDDLSDCPLGDLDELTAAVTNAIDLDEAVGEGTDESAITEESGSLPAFVSCQYFVEDESDVDSGATSVFFQGIYEPPRDYEDYITEFAGDVTDVDFDDPIEYAGGTIYRFCATAAADDGFTGCDADWVDDDHEIALNVFLGGDDADPDDAVAALKSVLSTMSASLAEQQ